MDMDLIALKIDPGSAAAQLDQFTTKLRITETQSQQTQASFTALNAAFKSMAQAMQQEQTALARIPVNNLAQGFGQLGEMMSRVQAVQDRLARANDPLAQGFARVAQQVQREHDVLMAIRQPQMEYFDTLTALDKLLERNAISTKEYADQVTSLNRSMGGAPKQESGGGIGLGDVAQLAAGGAAGVALLGIGHQIEDFADGYAKLDDQYTELYNHALKFATAGRSVDEVLAQQTDLAANLHSTLGEAMDAYDAVQDATVDLGLSQQQLIAATKAVGEASVISGKSMSGAGDVLNRLILAMDSGADSGRALKATLVGYDEVSDLLTRHFNTDRAGLIALAQQHKITSRDIADAFIQESAAEQENFDKRGITKEKETAMLLERIAINRKSMDEMTAVFEAGNPALKKFNESMQAWGGTLDDDSRATRFLTDEVRNFGQQLDDLKNKTNAAVRDGVSGFVGTVIDAGKAVTAAVSNYDELAKHLGIVDPWKVQTEAAKNLNHELDSEAKLLEQINAPMKEANALIKDSGDLYAKGAITVQQWAEQVERAQKLAGIDPAVRSIVSGEGGNFFSPFRGQPGAGFPTPTPDDFSDAHLRAVSYAGAQKPDPKAYEEFEARARDSLSGVDEGWKTILKDSTDSAKQIKTAMTTAFTDIQNALEDFVIKGKFDLGSLADEFEKIAVHLAIQQATGGIAGLIGGGMTGFDFLTPGSGGRHVFPGFQGGGDMTVGGSGAPDSKLAIFRVSPGESIHVRTPEQRAQAAAAAGGDTTNNYNFMYDPKQMVRGGIDAMQAHMRANPAVYRALLGIH